MKFNEFAAAPPLSSPCLGCATQAPLAGYGEGVGLTIPWWVFLLGAAVYVAPKLYETHRKKAS